MQKFGCPYPFPRPQGRHVAGWKSDAIPVDDSPDAARQWLDQEIEQVRQLLTIVSESCTDRDFVRTIQAVNFRDVVQDARRLASALLFRGISVHVPSEPGEHVALEDCLFILEALRRAIEEPAAEPASIVDESAGTNNGHNESCHTPPAQASGAGGRSTEQGECPVEPIAATVLTDDKSTERGDHQASMRLMNIYTNGLAGQRLDGAVNILEDEKLTVDEKLWKIEAFMPIPPTVSGAKLGEALGVSKAAVQKTTWYIENRKGRMEDEVARRHEQHTRRGQQYESGPVSHDE